MASQLKELVELLESHHAILRPLGFYDPKSGSVGAYPELPIGRCKSTQRFSNFQTDVCGELDQWHAHFPLVGSPVINSVIGLYPPGVERLAGFISLPSASKLDLSLVEAISNHGVVPDVLTSELTGSMSRMCHLGKTPRVDKLFIGPSNLRNAVYVEVDCGGQEFDVYGIFEEGSSADSWAPEFARPNQTYFDDLAAVWSGQPEIKGSYLGGFVFLASEFSVSLEAGLVDHDKVQGQAVGFRFPREGIASNAPEWRINSCLALANYISNPTPELARDAASWLMSSEGPAWAQFHFPDLDFVDPKVFPVSNTRFSGKAETAARCSSCATPFEFASDKFCGSCGTARGVLQ